MNITPAKGSDCNNNNYYYQDGDWLPSVSFSETQRDVQKENATAKEGTSSIIIYRSIVIVPFLSHTRWPIMYCRLVSWILMCDSRKVLHIFWKYMMWSKESVLVVLVSRSVRTNDEIKDFTLRTLRSMVHSRSEIIIIICCCSDIRF